MLPSNHNSCPIWISIIIRDISIVELEYWLTKCGCCAFLVLDTQFIFNISCEQRSFTNIILFLFKGPEFPQKNDGENTIDFVNFFFLFAMYCAHCAFVTFFFKTKICVRRPMHFFLLLFVKRKLLALRQSFAHGFFYTRAYDPYIPNH